jgi:membrane protein implicated in regulation of membrane protease activity
MLLITGLVLLFVLPTPWNVIVLLACILLWLGEVGIIWRFSRKKKVRTGTQTLVGRKATVISPCKPLGQVRLGGESEIWRARCAEGAEQGETVTIVGIDQLTLIVER